MERAEGMESPSTMTARPMVVPENFLMGLPFAGDIDFLEGRDRTTGFMELLGVSDFSASFIGSGLQQDFKFKGGISSPSPAINSSEGFELTDAPSTVPPTPNSSASSSSAEANDDESNSREGKDRLAANAQQEKEKRSDRKPKKKGTKREREPRFAFMTRSDVDHLEDGYRWRKYGQKAVKNSPFPRSYYRCTSVKCGVKKRVERSCDDPSIVITTYEGQHTHHSPVAAGRHSTTPTLPTQLLTHPPTPHLLQQQQQQQQQQSSRPQYALGSHALRTSVAAAAPLQQRDYGLLHDILTPRMRE
ncbi:putative WRKY transcription factor 57 [Nymphaea thermarum]|nr:putative WRKY transcription factor 57 [Nymphaea thermarum]